MLIVGLDAASQLKNFGFALGRCKAGKVKILAAGVLTDGVSVLHDCIADHVGKTEPILVAIDAPLGWPASLGEMLKMHTAGKFVAHKKDALFRRRTDEVVRGITRKAPMEVGADKIARATHSALEVLHQVRQTTGRALPMLWTAHDETGGVIEVYPGAMLKAMGISATKYKEPHQLEAREQIATALHAIAPRLRKYVEQKADVFDACLCLVAASDFLAGRCRVPTAAECPLAEKEGWIWVREPAQ